MLQLTWRVLFGLLILILNNHIPHVVALIELGESVRPDVNSQFGKLVHSFDQRIARPGRKYVVVQ